MSDTYNVWLIIIGLGVGTFALRFVFLGLIGSRNIPEWILRHLRYTPVAMLPAIAAPLALFPKATGGDVDPARLSAAIVTLAVGYFMKNFIAAVAAGAATLYLLLYLLGS